MGDAAEKDAPTGLVRIDSWKVVCDECRQDFESDNDWTIFADRWYAEDCARDHDWLIRKGLVLCMSCWEKNPYCRDEDDKCVRRDVTEADDGWRYCPEHIEQGMDAPTVIPPEVGTAHPGAAPGRADNAEGDDRG